VPTAKDTIFNLVGQGARPELWYLVLLHRGMVTVQLVGMVIGEISSHVDYIGKTGGGRRVLLLSIITGACLTLTDSWK